MSLKFPIMTNHTFTVIPIMANHHTMTDLFDLSKSIPSEISILSYCNIFILHTNTYLGKFEDTIYHFLQKHFSQ